VSRRTTNYSTTLIFTAAAVMTMRQINKCSTFVDCKSITHHVHPSTARARLRRQPIPTLQLYGMDRLIDNDILQSNIQEHILQSSHTIESSTPIFISSSSILLSNIFGAISYTLSSLTTLILPLVTQLQNIGETILTTVLILSVLQACVALYQYRYDERGQLVFPDGLTVGSEDYYASDNTKDTTTDIDNEDDGIVKEAKDVNTVVKDITDELFSSNTSDTNTNISLVSRLIKKLNKLSLILIPWVSRNIHNLLTRNTHLFHIGFIVFVLDSVLPLLDGNKGEEKKKIHTNTKSNEIPASLLHKIESHKDPLKVLVIGDSLAIGTGCIEAFDSTKDNSVPFALIENTKAPPQTSIKSHTHQGPVFPQVLARTLSYHFHQPVEWRSAGVDGGSLAEVDKFCMDVVKEESAKGIDVVVVLFGMNDLKKLLSTFVNPIQNLLSGGNDKEKMAEGRGTKQFRREMEMILSDIHSYDPDALVVFPTLPVQPFHKNSIINIFPLGMVVDSVLGLWEQQKKIVADRSKNAIHLELKAEEIKDWYSPGKSEGVDSALDVSDENNDILLSADGVHPNKKMYALWGGLVGRKLRNSIVSQTELRNENRLRT